MRKCNLEQNYRSPIKIKWAEAGRTGGSRHENSEASNSRWKLFKTLTQYLQHQLGFGPTTRDSLKRAKDHATASTWPVEPSLQDINHPQTPCKYAKTLNGQFPNLERERERRHERYAGLALGYDALHALPNPSKQKWSRHFENMKEEKGCIIPSRLLKCLMEKLLLIHSSVSFDNATLIQQHRQKQEQLRQATFLPYNNSTTNGLQCSFGVATLTASINQSNHIEMMNGKFFANWIVQTF